MLKILVTGHGNFAAGIKSNIELILGVQENISYLDFDGGDPELYAEKLAEIVNNCNDNLIIFCDIVGGTPFQKSALISQGEIKVIGGCNIPMIVSAVYNQTSDLELACQEIMNEGIKMIKMM